MARFQNLFLVAALALAATGNNNIIDDSYDDLTPGIVAGEPQIGNYHGLDYETWAVLGAIPGTGTNGGLIAHSAKNTALAANTTILVAPGSSTTSYMFAGSGTKCFDPISFYYGCIINSENGAADFAEACTISVSGTPRAGKDRIDPVQFIFPAPANPLAAPMLFADLSKAKNFHCLSSMTVSLVSGTRALIQIDDFKHTNH